MKTPTEVAALIADRIEALPIAAHRNLIAIAGPPASGKSTIAEKLHDRLNEKGSRAGLIAMDGFHLDNAILDARDLHARKGAPETFDLAGFAALLDRLNQGGEVIAPTFDRNLDISVGSSVVISPDMTTVVVEGNYLLLDEAGWRDLQKHWTFSVFLSPPLDVLEQRLNERWLDHGYSMEDAQAKAGLNDLPNAERILNRVSEADLRIDL